MAKILLSFLPLKTASPNNLLVKSLSFFHFETTKTFRHVISLHFVISSLFETFSEERQNENYLIYFMRAQKEKP